MKREKDLKNSIFIGLGVLSLIVLIIFSAFEYSLGNNKVFGLENYYSGRIGSEANPKEIYNTIYKNTIMTSSSCITKMTKATRPMSVSGFTWIVDGQSIYSKEDLEAITVNGNLTCLQPYKGNTSKKIVAPADLTFINANTMQYSEDKITIRAYLGEDYIIEFEDIAAWWCHIGKENPTQHTEVIGCGGLQARCTSEYIIGEAKDNTTVYLYHVEQQAGKTIYVPYSFADLFFKEE